MVSFQPDGRLLDGKGVTPSVVVEPNLYDFTGDRDTMLEHAVRVLRSEGGR
jgi:C-terminal processing protease CtpA/Prc